MSAVLSSELLKLRTTRTFAWVTGLAIFLTTLICGLAAALADYGPGDEPVTDTLELVFFTFPFALGLGALAMTTEFRHATVTPSLLAVPDRLTLLVAKVLAHLVAGILLALAALLIPLVIMLVIFNLRDVDSAIDAGRCVELIARSCLAAGLYSAIGVGFGAIVRNQVVATVVGPAWVIVVEPVLSAIPGLDFLSSYGLQGLASSTSGIEFIEKSDWLPSGWAGLLLVVYAAVLLGAGALLLQRRDVDAK